MTITNCFQQNLEAELLTADFLQYYYYSEYNINSNFSNSFVDEYHSWYDPYDLLNLENHDHDTTTDDHLLLPHNSFSLTAPDFNPYPNPKRQKFFPTPLPKFDQLPEDLTNSAGANINHGHESITNVANKKKVGEKCVSAQSIAARERRRKITEKTQALGKLVPGGSKMNTAEMLTAAYNYVKYLQAQVGILQLMGSFKELKEAPPIEELQVVASPVLQEKLYLENNCLVPKKFVAILAEHFDAQSKPSLSNNLNLLLTSTT
nr:transcription factor bHLH117-like [Malus domestica]